MTIRDLLSDAGITQADLARDLGLTKGAVSRKLSGDRGWTPWEVVKVFDLLTGKPWRGRQHPRPTLRSLCFLCSPHDDV